MASLREAVLRRKPVVEMAAETGTDSGGSELSRSISLFQLTMFGVGATIGTGIFFVLSEAVPIAGPAVVAHARLVITGGDGHRLHEEVIVAGGHLRGGRFARFDTLREQTAVLDAATEDVPNAATSDELAGAWETVSEPLYRALEARAKDRAESLARVLAERAESDATAITTVMQELQRTITQQLDDLERDDDIQSQLTLFEPDERQQFTRDLDALRRRLDEIPAEIDREVAAVRQRYADPQRRLFPAAVTYLVPGAAAARRAS